MLVKYIDENGNFAQLETLVDPKWESKLDKVGSVYYAKRTVVEVKPTKEEKIVETPVTDAVEFDADAAKAYLKEKGVKGYQLLKGDSLKNKAIAE
jgi:hypothetical protein